MDIDVVLTPVSSLRSVPEAFQQRFSGRVQQSIGCVCVSFVL